MIKLCVTVLLLCLFSINSIGQTLASDSLDAIADWQNFLDIHSRKIDSLEASFTHSAHSLTQEYHERLSKIDSVQRQLESKLNIVESMKVSIRNLLSTPALDSSQRQWMMRMDSLKLLNKYSKQVSGVLDSVRALHERTFSELKTKVESLKQKTVGKFNELNLPPQLSNKVNEVSSRINGIKVPTSDFKVSEFANQGSFGIHGLDKLNFPTAQHFDPSKIDLVKGIGDLSQVSNIGEGLSEHMTRLEEITKGSSDGIDAIENLAETQSGELSGLSDIKGKTEILNEFKDLTEQIKNPDSIKQYAFEQANDIAVDHFAGKEEQLTEAIQTLARYKAKYPNLNSISEATRRPPNEMKGKPLIERIVPGIAMQVQKKGDDFMADFNPYVGYRFTGRISAGLGWNQRGAYSFDQQKFNSRARIFGPRLFGEFKLWRGFSPRAEIELMNKTIPPLARSHSVDVLHCEWIWGAFAGMKKEYMLFKNVKGTASVMMRLYNPDRKSPYADVVNARFGFEFPKKKVAKVK